MLSLLMAGQIMLQRSFAFACACANVSHIHDKMGRIWQAMLRWQVAGLGLLRRRSSMARRLLLQRVPFKALLVIARSGRVHVHSDMAGERMQHHGATCGFHSALKIFLGDKV